MKRVVVVGGGASGLSAAYFLQERARESGDQFEILLVEKNHHLGGSILTERVDGFVIEGGPDCFLSEKPWGLKLCERLDMADRVMNTNKNRRTFILSRGKLHEIPEGFMLLAPTKIMPFVRSTLISPLGKIRMAMDWIIPRKKTGEEETLAQFVRRRLGTEALEKIAEPLVAGIHASVPESMSLKATFPRFLDLEHEYGSLIRGMLARRKKFAEFLKHRKGPERTMFVTMKDGMGELIEALRDRLDPGSIRLEKGAIALGRESRKESPSYRLRLEGDETLGADVVVLATPSFVSGDLIVDLDRPLRDLLYAIPYVSSAIVHLAYPRSEIRHPLDGFGFVVPRTEKRNIMASTWTSVKFANRAPDGQVLLRVFMGGAKNERALCLRDDEMVATSRKELEDIMGIKAAPHFTRVYRWEKSMPQYRLGHLERVAEIEERVSQHPGMFLIGCAYRGVGISDCIHEGELVADRVMEYLNSRPSESGTREHLDQKTPRNTY